MKVGIMQPYFFPYLGYWQLINIVDKYIIFDDVNYIKRGWINRNKILYEGNERFINIYLCGVSQNKLINEIKIGNKSDNDSTMRIVYDAYKKAPYFKDIFPFIECIFSYPADNIAQFNGNQIQEVCKYLEIDTQLYYSSEIIKNNKLKGQDKIIDICKSLGANEYYNAIGGVELYDKKKFIESGIDIYFVKTNSYCYKQFTDIFVPNLSIIDIMMFNSKNQIKKMLDNYYLV